VSSVFSVVKKNGPLYHGIRCRLKPARGPRGARSAHWGLGAVREPARRPALRAAGGPRLAYSS